MKIYLKRNVYDSALDRMRYLFDEFPNVIASTSGGKDSTVIVNLALQVAEEKGRLPLKVLFVDQEAEWEMVIDHVREVMHDPRVEPLWLQMPIVLFNATSPFERWLHCWDPERKDDWMRPKESDSIHENIYGEKRFHDIFAAFIRGEYPDTKTCYLSGVRCEESANRFMGLTGSLKYKDITWGKKLDVDRGHYTFYPIYDWSYRDVWKAIHDHGWSYCHLYDLMYQHGINVMAMRVSNLHHETAVRSLFYLQKFEPDTWNKLTKRIPGIDTAGKLGWDDFWYHGELPFMFAGWIEYRDYLLQHLIVDDEIRERFAGQFRRLDDAYFSGRMKTGVSLEDVCKAEINAILTNDYFFVKLGNFESYAKKTRKERRATKLKRRKKRIIDAMGLNYE